MTVLHNKGIPVSNGRRETLRTIVLEDPAALFEKAGLAGANMFFLFTRLGVDFDELSPLLKSVVNFK
jgi:hypothetical protein